MTIGKNRHTAMTLFLAKTKGRDLVTVRALGEIAPDPGCK
jgi:branched-chain amino acid transport system substrate-binding protein/urea transport system substrate-binding protein